MMFAHATPYHPINFSADSEAFQGWYQGTRMAFTLLEPFLVQSGVTTSQELRRLHEQALTDMLSNDFNGMWIFLTVSGQKP